MPTDSIRRVHRVTALISVTGVIFCLFFQVNKGGPFRDVNPFGVDPYDAVGSFAIQIALLVGLLTYARALRWLDDPAQAAKARLVLRGNALVLGAISVTLLADAVAVARSPLPSSTWGNVLRLELGAMCALAGLCAVAWSRVFRRVPMGPAPRDLTPADGFDDLWTLLRVPVARGSALLPRGWAAWVTGWSSDRLFARARWLDPRAHPWRFACALGLLVGVALVLAQLQEGAPPSLGAGLLVASIYVGGELGATLLGFALLGGWLGLRPA